MNPVLDFDILVDEFRTLGLWATEAAEHTVRSLLAVTPPLEGKEEDAGKEVGQYASWNESTSRIFSAKGLSKWQIPIPGRLTLRKLLS